ncbi:hypothetical protein F9C07_1849091 [Aspergillus flavus]|uniref:Uncharacterized protein n=3 Tax=Aspergillus subgen. Circumdati TaxID=2720871 RepID=A0A7U2R125_ASPFN|nr:hypothetical protein Ao3042_09733 [Aspergillus oryzae 3.042]QRD91542.1 hypothetical protein F9C07_1849091 [Aspergillus flavus]UDD64241.1 hypothetical protein AFCA_011482 [Aspergillus flavus]|eukprot:EIT74185.1 hypothetical protein Ao3042_09733 [Aspergillus oryzae 3.042]
MASCHSYGFSMTASSPSRSRSSETYFPAAPSSSSSCSPRVLTPPSPTLQQHNTLPSPIQPQLRILVTMGPCTWRDGYLRCSCESGSSLTSDLNVNNAVCRCRHSMLLHQSASPSQNITVPTVPESRVVCPLELQPFAIARETLVDEVIARVNHYHIIRVNGTPASGKTTLMTLVANELLIRYGKKKPIYSLPGWGTSDTRIGWATYLEQETGVHGRKWLTYPAYLLLDEAQQSLWDENLWTDLFKRLEPVTGPFIILFMSYGSPHRGFVGFGGEEHARTPINFAPEQQISLQPEESIGPQTLAPPRWRPVGLLLNEDEAEDVVERYASAALSSNMAVILTRELKQGLFACSNGHVGLLTSLTRMLQDTPEFYEHVRTGSTVDWTTARRILFRKPLVFFNSLKVSPFGRGLPPEEILQHPSAAAVFKVAITCDGLYKSQFRTENEELKQALKWIWQNGWLHAEKSYNDIRYVFASQIHRWFCHTLFTMRVPDNNIIYTTPLQLAIHAITKFQPSQLAMPPRSRAVEGNVLPLEDQYQKEFYRCLFPILDGHFVLSPEFVVKAGPKGGTIDFLIAEKKWGLELLRERDRLVEHMRRFEQHGQYYSMLKSGEMEQYIVLDFTNTAPKKSRPEYKKKLYHVVFTDNYRHVDVIDGSDLSVVQSFVLLEQSSSNV